MAALPVDDAWMEEAMIAIAKIGEEDMAFAALTETIDFDLGGKDIEGVPLTNGGRITKWSPEGDSSVTMELYPLEAGTLKDATVGTGVFDLMHTVDETVPIRVLNTRNRDKYRILVMWTNGPAATAQAITTDTYSALRIGLADGHFNSVKPSFTDGILKFTVTYKCAAFDKAGTANVLMESAAGSGATDILPAVAAYTTSNKFS